MICHATTSYTMATMDIDDDVQDYDNDGDDRQ